MAITVSPVAVNDSVSTAAGTALTISKASLLANDDGRQLAITSASSPMRGSVLVDAQNVTYTPPPGYSGSDSFTYVLNGDGGSTSAQVNIVVRPAASPDETMTKPGAPVSGSVLGNDSGVGLTVASHTDPEHGSLVMAASGSYTYTPNAGFSESTGSITSWWISSVRPLPAR